MRTEPRVAAGSHHRKRLSAAAAHGAMAKEAMMRQW